LQLANKNNPHITTLKIEQEVRKLKLEVRKIVKMKFFCIGILQQPIGTLQIPSRDLQRVFQICKANKENSK
jgi:hypothetical protein